VTGGVLGPLPEITAAVFDGPFSQIWPILILPALAGLISDRSARLLPPTRADWRVATALAAFPGAVMLALIGMFIGRAAFHLHWDGVGHMMKYHVPLALGFAILGAAAWRSAGRARELRRVTRMARPPCPRLAEASAAVGLPARELPLEGFECFVAGARRPTAFVSRGAISRLSGPELLAALHHERAHAAARDPAVLAVLAFLGDLAPGTDRALTAYRHARERRADREAARQVGSCVLATALLAVTRPQIGRAHV
jgi:Zn-dependent protease with chaperone function